MATPNCRAANLYINSGAISLSLNEVDFSRTVYARQKELAVKAIRNDLATGSFSQITPVANGSVTVDSIPTKCANVVAALTTNWQILDTTLSTSTAYSGTVTNPDPLITGWDLVDMNFRCFLTTLTCLLSKHLHTFRTPP